MISEKSPARANTLTVGDHQRAAPSWPVRGLDHRSDILLSGPFTQTSHPSPVPKGVLSSHPSIAEHHGLPPLLSCLWGISHGHM